MGLVWFTPPTKALPELMDAYELKVKQAVKALCLRYAPDIENWLKANGPWQDRTGNARQGLYAEVEELVNAVVIHLGHSVPYGIHLELGHAGRFAVIGPAVEHFAPQILQDLQAMLR